MLRIRNGALARGARTLYRDVNLLAAPGERVGLVGANGCGKSSLFSALLGALLLENGDLDLPRADRIAHLAQDIESQESSALAYVLEGHAPLAQAHAALAAAERSGDDLELSHAHAQLAEIDTGAIAAQARTVLHGLGFAPGAADAPVASFSGGWRNRLALARTLMRPADLLLLDEPTNHLDLDSVLWLEAWLRRQPATVLIISHDREFLDRCVETIWHVDGETIRRHAGNYTSFESARAERLRQQDALARSTARTAAHLQQFVDRFRAQATKARQAQSRMKMLERLVQVEPVRATREWRFLFPKPEKVPDHLVTAMDLQLGYGGQSILRDVKLRIEAGDRIGVLGVNGAGKSTLIKAIAGSLAPEAGTLQRASGTKIGYFAQHQLDQLDGDDSPLAQLRRIAPDTREQELRDFLGVFRFSGEMATTPVGRMSGGEKARCALALLAWQRPNLLVLDEPTNHLDMETREALTMALSAFDGALLLVSHDRHLLRAATDRLWLVRDNALSQFDGDLDEYAALVLADRREQRRAEESAAEATTGATPPSAGKRDDRRIRAQERERVAQAQRPIRKRLDAIERTLHVRTEELRALDEMLADPGIYSSEADHDVPELLKQRAQVAATIETLEMEWLAGQEELERIAATPVPAAAGEEETRTAPLSRNGRRGSG